LEQIQNLDQVIFRKEFLPPSCKFPEKVQKSTCKGVTLLYLEDPTNVKPVQVGLSPLLSVLRGAGGETGRKLPMLPFLLLVSR
jgi:hypothetical protein